MAYNELKVPLPLITDRGSGLAIAVIDESIEHHLIWVVILDDSGEIWCIENPKVRATKNITMGRLNISEIEPKPPTEEPMPF